MKRIIVTAPAKINLTLDVLDTDSRGYHMLDMLMHRISLYDRIYITPQKSGITLASSKKNLACDETNTAYKAAKYFFEYARVDGGCDIYLSKYIPSGAGFGGGSADAAGVLKGLNHLYGSPLSEDVLNHIALKIGSDVPYMLKNGLCRVRGTGEIIEPLPSAPPLHLLCAMRCRYGNSTAKVYEKYDEIGSSSHPDTDAFLAALYENDIQAFPQWGGNALSESAIAVSPAAGTALKKLRAANARYVLITGSGSASYGIFPSRGEASRAVKYFNGMWHKVCTTVDSGIIVSEEEI